ncbi:MAG: DUF2341 domain-containing protein, partial [Verrucomicrobiota bacterium]
RPKVVFAFRMTNCVEQTWTVSRSFVTRSSPTNYPYRLQICFPGYIKPSALANFPALVVLDNGIAGFAYNQFGFPDGRDLRFFNSNETVELNYEIDEWDTNSSSLVWVQLPTLSGTNTCIWAVWGNPAVSVSPEYTTNGATWSEGFEGVWHMKEVNALDSGPFDRDGTAAGNPMLAPGPIGNGLAFDGTGDSINVTGYRGILGQSNRTVSAWVRTAQDNGAFVNWGNNVAGQKWTFRIQVGNGQPGAIRTEINGGYIVHDRDIRDNQWHHVVIEWAVDASPNIIDANLYVDAQPGLSTLLAQSLNTMDNTDVRFANDFVGRALMGDMDEIRISNVARSPDWICAEFLNSASNSIFNQYGLVISPTGGVDLAMIKTASTNLLDIGSNLTYTLTITNSGSGAANGVVVTDALPAQVIFNMSVPPADQTNGNELVYMLPAIAPGGSFSILIDVTVTAAMTGSITNVASTISAGPDQNIADNMDEAVTAIPDSDGDGVANPADPDDDNDGSSDADELIAATDPLDPGSFLWIQIDRTGAIDTQQLTFPSVIGRTYKIEGTLDVVNGPWFDVMTNIPGTGSPIMLPDNNSTNRLYYRIGVESP